MKIGLLGGTFDPPHLGHMIMAEEALKSCHLDEVWFLPSYLPPHAERKAAKTPTPAENRLDMVRLAIRNNPRFRLSLIEYERKGKSYTYETIRQLKVGYPMDDFYFIIGADMVNDLPKWVRIEEIVQQMTFIGFNRADVEFTPPEGIDLIEVHMPDIEISSSLIRKRIKGEKAWRYFVPESVKNYIEVNGLYE